MYTFLLTPYIYTLSPCTAQLMMLCYVLVYAPSVIQQQMLFQQNTMLKAFLAAVASCKQFDHELHVYNILFTQQLQCSQLSMYCPSLDHSLIR